MRINGSSCTWLHLTCSFSLLPCGYLILSHFSLCYPCMLIKRKGRRTSHACLSVTSLFWPPPYNTTKAKISSFTCKWVWDIFPQKKLILCTKLGFPWELQISRAKENMEQGILNSEDLTALRNFKCCIRWPRLSPPWPFTRYIIWG